MHPPHLDSDPWLSRPALELVVALERREISAEELTRRVLERIDRLNPRLQAFVRTMPRQALDAARRADKNRGDRRSKGFFHGIPMGVKDLNFLRGAFASMGTPQYRYLPSPIDDSFVKAMRRAGFVFVGKTATSELGIMPVTETLLGPPTRNPWDESKSAGGSSGGAGAAVAGGLLPMAHASDGAGSIRIPAAFGGLFGHKASVDLLPNPYGRNDPFNMTANGAVTLTLRDTAAFLDAILGRWPGDPGTFLASCEETPAPVRIGFVTVPPIGETDPRVAAHVLRIAGALEGLGHHVTEGPVSRGSLEEFLPVYQRIAAKAPLLTEQTIQPVTRWLRGVGRGISDSSARASYDAMSQRIQGALGDVEVVLMPTVPILPPRVGAFDHSDGETAFAQAAVLGAFTSLANVTGRPALTVPAGTVDGLPVGVMLMGRRGEDALLLQLARQLEACGALRHAKGVE